MVKKTELSSLERMLSHDAKKRKSSEKEKNSYWHLIPQKNWRVMSEKLPLDLTIRWSLVIKEKAVSL